LLKHTTTGISLQGINSDEWGGRTKGLGFAACFFWNAPIKTRFGVETQRGQKSKKSVDATTGNLAV